MHSQINNLKTPVHVTPGQRQFRQLDLFFLGKKKALKCNSKFLKPKSGRNHSGKITIGHRGGRHKRLYRAVDFTRKKGDGVVVSIDYDPFRRAPIARVFNFKKGSFFYILASKNLYVSSLVRSYKGEMADNLNCDGLAGTQAGGLWNKFRNVDSFRLGLGDSVCLSEFPNGSSLYALSTSNSGKGIMCRSAGTSAVLVQKNITHARVRLPSGVLKIFPANCIATYGVVANEDAGSCQIGKAGRSRWYGKRPNVRGVAMNPVDHPHGGGEGKTSGGRVSVTPWGKPTRGPKTRRNKKKVKIPNM